MIRQAYGRLAQLVERFVYTEDVGSSSLSSPTIFPLLIFENSGNAAPFAALHVATVVRCRRWQSVLKCDQYFYRGWSMALNNPKVILRILFADYRKNPPLRVLTAIIVLTIVWATFLTLEPWLRWCGMTLQLCGFYLVYVSIDKRRQSFGDRRIMRNLSAWLNSIFVRPPPITATMQATEIGVDVLVGRARLTHRAKRDASLEERLAIIEQARLDTQRELDAVWEKIDKVETDLTASIKHESVSWKAKTSASEQKFSDAIAGDIHIDLLGVWMFALGVLIASASVEIKFLVDGLIAVQPI
jgi:hypothetical protein